MDERAAKEAAKQQAALRKEAQKQKQDAAKQDVAKQDAAKQDEDDDKKSQCAAHTLTNTAQRAPFQAGQHSLREENSRKRDRLSRSNRI